MINNYQKNYRSGNIYVAVVPVDKVRPIHLQQDYGFHIGTVKFGRQNNGKRDIPNWMLDCRKVASDTLTLEQVRELACREFCDMVQRKMGRQPHPLVGEHFVFLGEYTLTDHFRDRICLVFGALFTESAAYFTVKNTLEKNKLFSQEQLYLDSYHYSTLERYFKEGGVMPGGEQIVGVLKEVLAAGDLPERVAYMRPLRALALLPKDFDPSIPPTFPIPIQAEGIAPTPNNIREHWHVGVSVVMLQGRKESEICIINRTQRADMPYEKDPFLDLVLPSDHSALFPLTGKLQQNDPITLKCAKQWAACIADDKLRSPNFFGGPSRACYESNLVYLGAYPHSSEQVKRLSLIFGMIMQPPFDQPYFISTEAPTNHPFMECITLRTALYTPEQLTQMWHNRETEHDKWRFDDVICALLTAYEPENLVRKIVDETPIPKWKQKNTTEKKLGSKEKSTPISGKTPSEWKSLLIAANNATWEVNQYQKLEAQRPFSKSAPDDLVQAETAAWLAVTGIPREILNEDECE